MITMLVQQMTEDGLAATRGVLYLAALVSVWAIAFALRYLAKAASALFKVLLIMIAVTALGTAAIAIIAQVVLAIGQV